jgi:hypothetical protein
MLEPTTWKELQAKNDTAKQGATKISADILFTFNVLNLSNSYSFGIQAVLTLYDTALVTDVFLSNYMYTRLHYRK